jgi:HSP20 family protein
LSNELKKKEEWVWNPDEVLRQLDTMIEDFKKNVVMPMMPMMPMIPMKAKAWQHHIMKAPRVDLNDLGDHYEAFIEVPGIEKEAVQVHMTNNTLEVNAEVEMEKEEKKECLMRERSHEEVYRRITFPEEIIPEEAEARVTNGLLTVTVPKKHKPQERTKIEVK